MHQTNDVSLGKFLERKENVTIMLNITEVMINDSILRKVNTNALIDL